MKKIAKYGFIMLAILLLASSTAAKNLDARLLADSVNVLPGETVEYRISISGNPGLAAMKVQLEYDTEVLQPVTYDASQEVVCQRGSFSKKGSVSGALTNQGCQFMWYHTADVHEDGTVLSFQFQVSETAQPGEYPVLLTCSPWDITDKDGNLKEVRCEAGKVEVHTYHPMLYTEPQQVRRGEIFDYPVHIIDNPGIAALQANLIFDQTKLEPVIGEDGYAVCELGENFMRGALQTKKYTNAIVALWYQATDAAGDGTVVTFKLRAKEDAVLGKADIQLKLEPKQTLNQNEEPVALDVQNAELQILSDIETQISRTSDRDLKITILAPVGTNAVTAVYDEQGRQLELFSDILTEKNTLVTKTVRESLDGHTCRVFLLDQTNTPIAEAAEQVFL